jgi:DNA-binding transcriptional ArsR family regulator
MYLDRVLGSTTKVNILSVLINITEQGIIESNLAEKAGVSSSEVNRQIDDLVTINLVKLNRIGRSKLYFINKEHFLYEPLSVLFRTLDSIYLEIANKIKDYILSITEVETVILIGSLTTRSIRQNYVSNPSDIDVILVVNENSKVNDIKKQLVVYNMKEIYPVYGVNVYTIVLSTKDYIDGLSKDKFIMNVHTHGETLYGKKPTRTSSMVS